MSKKPKAPISPRLAARARTRPDRPAFGSAFQMAFSADCISPNTPVAVISNVTTPMTVARMPLDLLPALATMACNASAPCWPIRPCNCPTIAPCAASCPNTSPAMAMQSTSIGAMENTVK